MTIVKTKPKQPPWPIRRKESTFQRSRDLKVRKRPNSLKSRKTRATKSWLVLVLHHDWLVEWREFSEPITGRSKAKLNAIQGREWGVFLLTIVWIGRKQSFFSFFYVANGVNKPAKLQGWHNAKGQFFFITSNWYLKLVERFRGELVKMGTNLFNCRGRIHTGGRGRGGGWHRSDQSCRLVFWGNVTDKKKETQLLRRG